MLRKISVVLSLITFVAIFTNIVTLDDRSKINDQVEGENEDASGAMQALDFWTRSRAYPEYDVPANKYFKAFQAAIAKRKEVSKISKVQSIWNPIGPTNLQGRAISVALNPLNPNTVLVGTASGGLWCSHTSGIGANWRQVVLGYPALGISAIVIDPVDTNVIYIGTGEHDRKHEAWSRISDQDVEYPQLYISI